MHRYIIEIIITHIQKRCPLFQCICTHKLLHTQDNIQCVSVWLRFQNCNYEESGFRATMRKNGVKISVFPPAMRPSAAVSRTLCTLVDPCAVCVCVCVCVWCERESVCVCGERERERVCVCVV